MNTKSLLFIFLFICTVSAKFSNDTVYTSTFRKTDNTLKRSTTFKNTTNQIVTMDSVTISADTAFYKNDMYAIEFGYMTLATRSVIESEAGKQRTYFNAQRINPLDSLVFMHFGIGYCFCLVKSKSREYAGDTVSIKAVFHFNNEKDTIQIIGDMESENVMKDYHPVTVNNSINQSGNKLLLNGKSVKSSSATGVIINQLSNKSSKKITLLKSQDPL